MAEFIRLMDVLFMLVAFQLASKIRFSTWFVSLANDLLAQVGHNPIPAMFPDRSYDGILWLAVPVFLFFLSYYKAYDFARTNSFFAEFLNLFKVQVAAGILVLSIVFLTGITEYNRPLFAIFVLLNFTFAVTLRFAIVLFLRKSRTSERNRARAVIIGNGEKALKALVELNGNRHWGFTIDGIITERPIVEKSILGLSVLGSMGELEAILRRTPADDVFVAMDEGRYVELKEILKICENIGVSVHLLPDKYDLEIAKSSVGNLGSMEFITFFTVVENPAQRFAKRALDICVSLALLPLLLVIYAIAGILIKLDSEGPVIYKSIRLTRNRRPFVFYKFRTMSNGAEEELERVLKENLLNGPITKIKGDSRVTRIGSFLRKYSIDELPQIINVLLGDMSLVGPRPPLPEEVNLYTLPQLRKLSMHQGITGLWQVSGRDEIVRFEDRLKLDLEYIDNWSLWLDVKILFKTFFVIFKGAM